MSPWVPFKILAGAEGHLSKHQYNPSPVLSLPHAGSYNDWGVGI